MSTNDLVSFMDLLDLDEEIIDTRLKCVMSKQTLTRTHYNNAINLLKYKILINSQDDMECDNNEEFEFATKLLGNIQSENIDQLCTIINIVLNLNPSTIASKSEHLLQQILSSIDLSVENSTTDTKSLETLHYLSICDSILDAVLQNNEKLAIYCLELPLKEIFNSSSVTLKTHFLTHTVPRLFKGVIAYNVLDNIWNYVKLLKGQERIAGLKIVSTLSDYYLPNVNTDDVRVESNMILQFDFWDLVLFGLMSDDPFVRKLAIYLAKRAIDCAMNMGIKIDIKKENQMLFYWDQQCKNSLHKQWSNFFILLESLEEKQSNIVLPCLQLFETVPDIGDIWLNSALNIGLKHDNTQVKIKCIKYRCTVKIKNESETLTLLDALNDINLYDISMHYENIKENILSLFKCTPFLYILRSISLVKWSPVPFFHISDILSRILSDSKEAFNNAHLCKNLEIIKEILLISCNVVPIRKVVHLNILKTIIKKIEWRDILYIFPFFQIDRTRNSITHKLLKDNLVIKTDEETAFINEVVQTHVNIDIGLIYFENKKENIHMLTDIISRKIKNITSVINRQYCDKLLCLPDVVFLIQILKKVNQSEKHLKDCVVGVIKNDAKVLLQYLLVLFANEKIICLDDMKLLTKDLMFFFDSSDDSDLDFLLQLYKTSILLLKDDQTDINRKIYSSLLIKNLSYNKILIKHCKHEMLDLNRLLKLLSSCKLDIKNDESDGKLKNLFYESNCELLSIYLDYENDVIKSQLRKIISYIENVIEIGGYGCLKWIMRIVNKIVPLIEKHNDFNITQFIERLWKEIEELKSNNKYGDCMKEFVRLINQDKLLNDPNYNNIFLTYCNRIVDLGQMRNSPLFYLVNEWKGKSIENYAHIIHILCEILLFSPVLRKDQRIVESLVMAIIKDPNHSGSQTVNSNDIIFNYEIQYASISKLCKITQTETLEAIEGIITRKIDDLFKNKKRYCGNSSPHRILMSALQCMLTIVMLKSKNIQESCFKWCSSFLGKLPHQNTIKIALEWYISLYIYSNKLKLNSDLLHDLKSSNVPVTSVFQIFYWITKHKILYGTIDIEEYDFVMNTLLSHSMGPTFNLRLNAQYLSLKLYQINKHSNKYSYTMEIIEKTFDEGADDKNFVKITEDYFINEFDILSHLVPSFVYYFLPKYFDSSLYEDDVMNAWDFFNEELSSEDCTDLKKEWLNCHLSKKDVLNLKFRINEASSCIESIDATGIIQKKYIPWKNMTDIDAYEANKKKVSASELILVASLIDKLPNLGGMARTSEVFGVKTYIVDSLRHLQDKQFQGLSVSAERWVDIQEVRPGPPLKEFLLRMKTEGYTVVAAEQTSTSCQLQTFKFPRKTILLLGHEKDGVPCDLLPLMDHCVEIPQQGFVRSLNVHVTAAIFVWEYTRQHLL